jgi:hypothetical protein
MFSVWISLTPNPWNLADLLTYTLGEEQRYSNLRLVVQALLLGNKVSPQPFLN